MHADPGVLSSLHWRGCPGSLGDIVHQIQWLVRPAVGLVVGVDGAHRRGVRLGVDVEPCEGRRRIRHRRPDRNTIQLAIARHNPSPPHNPSPATMRHVHSSPSAPSAALTSASSSSALPPPTDEENVWERSSPSGSDASVTITQDGSSSTVGSAGSMAIAALPGAALVVSQSGDPTQPSSSQSNRPSPSLSAPSEQSPAAWPSGVTGVSPSESASTPVSSSGVPLPFSSPGPCLRSGTTQGWR